MHRSGSASTQGAARGSGLSRASGVSLQQGATTPARSFGKPRARSGGPPGRGRPGAESHRQRTKVAVNAAANGRRVLHDFAASSAANSDLATLTTMIASTKTATKGLSSCLPMHGQGLSACSVDRPAGRLFLAEFVPWVVPEVLVRQDLVATAVAHPCGQHGPRQEHIPEAAEVITVGLHHVCTVPLKVVVPPVEGVRVVAADALRGADFESGHLELAHVPMQGRRGIGAWEDVARHEEAPLNFFPTCPLTNTGHLHQEEPVVAQHLADVVQVHLEVLEADMLRHLHGHHLVEAHLFRDLTVVHAEEAHLVLQARCLRLLAAVPRALN
mmetsp:Transcript_42984/g.119621  ORF Transcript_42984/g.119621 Transcript_42984/m.119621 type:complete len:328 (-) Transcript_42984:828-1811(-)